MANLEQFRWVIYAPTFDEYSGGAIALHRLCDLLNRSGVESCLYPMKPQTSRRKSFRYLRIIVKAVLDKLLRTPYKTFDKFMTPLCDAFDPNNDIVVYPEIIVGNPLGAENVVRWLLHEPGYFAGDFLFGKDDLFFYYQKAFLKETATWNIGGELEIIYMQDVYRKRNVHERSGTCYILRKGKDRGIVHDLNNSVLIDGLSHAEIAEIFNRSEACISYDMYTMYSRYAAACGCLSIVVPEPAVDKYQWRPEEELRWGIAYGFDDVEWAKSTQNKVLPSLMNQEKETNQASIDNFIQKCEMHFFRN